MDLVVIKIDDDRHGYTVRTNNKEIIFGAMIKFMGCYVKTTFPNDNNDSVHFETEYEVCEEGIRRLFDVYFKNAELYFVK